MNGSSHIGAGGEQRLHDAIRDQVRLEFAKELATATEYWAHAALEKKIEDEVKRRMKEVSSPQSLWNA
jgi:hypothetical protein